MGTPVHVAVVVPIIVDNGLDHRLGLLRGGGIVQIHQRLAMHLLMQDREVLAYLFRIKGSAGCQRRFTHRSFAPASRRPDRTGQSAVDAGNPGWPAPAPRSEERRVGKEGRSRW